MKIETWAVVLFPKIAESETETPIGIINGLPQPKNPKTDIFDTIYEAQAEAIARSEKTALNYVAQRHKVKA